jgi:porin
MRREFIRHGKIMSALQTLLRTAWLWALVGATLPAEVARAQAFDDPSIADRPYLSDDGIGPRAKWADRGITFDTDITQFANGVTSGGVAERFRYAGHGDYVANVDFEELCDQEGLFLKVRVEHNFGDTLSSSVGSFMPPAVTAELPTGASHKPYVTNFVLTQHLTETLGVYAGKVDTLDGDQNAFASGRGEDQFLNYGLVGNAALLRTVPYSTLGGGIFVMRQGRPVWTLSVLNAVDTTRTIGFDDLFDQGAVVVSETRIPTNFFGRPGHQLFGGTWSARNFTTIGEDPRIMLPAVPTNRVDGSSSFYWNFDQFLVVDPECPDRGWGVFGRVGAADDRANPVSWFFSAGIGGNSPLRCRGADRFGIGWYFLNTSSSATANLAPTLGPLGDEQGVEMFYNLAVYRWMHLTADAQFIDPARAIVPAAQIVGLRLKIDL